MAEHWESVDDWEEWFVCPNCGSGDVKAEYFSQWADYRQRVECEECGEKGYFD